MKTAICPGSFDPVTLGHLDIIERAAGLFDQVTVLVMQNSAKQDSLFTVEERCRLIRRCLHAENIQIDTYDGLLVDYAKQTGAAAVVKGLRALSDFEYEFQQALTNKSLCPQLETVFLTAKGENMFLSSSMVKEVCRLDGDILLEDLEDVLDDATSMPMTKKSLVDVDKIKTIIEDIRLNTPQETKQAKAIVDSRNNILDEAKKEAAKIISEAQAQARELVARDQITQNAQKEATEIIAKAHSEGEAYVKQAQNQASELLGKATTQANEMVTTAQNKSREMLTAVNNYADDTLLEIDDSLYKALSDVRRIRQNIMNSQHRNTSANDNP